MRSPSERVGLILSLEVSRISRANSSWYHLLDICAVTHTLIGDAEGLYDPRLYNDRLLLGLKGTMNEAELYVMKQRLIEAVRSKAQRGEFRLPLPPGYVWDEAGRVQKNPDEQVRTTIELIFERFEQIGTAHGVYVALLEEGIQIPVRNGCGERFRWRSPSPAAILRMLKNPDVCRGLCLRPVPGGGILDEAQHPLKRMRAQPHPHWHVLIKDHHEGYLTWESYERNQRRILCNRRGEPSAGAPREGASLLQGRVLCGRCGRPMRMNYTKRSRLLRYVCRSTPHQGSASFCQSFGAIRLERAFEQLVLEALAPLGMEAMIEAAANHDQDRERERALWQQQLERARYEVDLARRQYDAVDPANRLVAGELERRWEQTLGVLEALKTEVA